MADIAVRLTDKPPDYLVGREVLPHGMGFARMVCYIGDTDPSLRRLDLDLTPSTWGIWILSHIDLRSTARVRVAREFLVESIEGQREVVLGEQSKYYKAA